MRKVTKQDNKMEYTNTIYKNAYKHTKDGSRECIGTIKYIEILHDNVTYWQDPETKAWYAEKVFIDNKLIATSNNAFDAVKNVRLYKNTLNTKLSEICEINTDVAKISNEITKCLNDKRYKDLYNISSINKVI